MDWRNGVIVLAALLMQVAVVPSAEASESYPDDIVVTARRDNEQFRLRPLRLPSQRGEVLPKAEVALFKNLKLAAEGEKGEGPGQANRAMVRFKLAF
jgi:hypothetical protein